MSSVEGGNGSLEGGDLVEGRGFEFVVVSFEGGDLRGVIAERGEKQSDEWKVVSFGTGKPSAQNSFAPRQISPCWRLRS